MNLKIKAFVVASLLSLAASGVHTANAADGTAPAAHTVAVNYSDLDLTTEAGNRLLYQRIRAAADKVCPAVRATGTRIPVRDWRCVDDAVAQAVKGIHSPMLAQVHTSYAHHQAGG